MDMELITFLKEDLLILVVVLVIVGKMIKETTLIKDKFIPIVLGIFSCTVLLIENGFAFDSVFQGIIAAALAVYGNQTIKQLQKKEE